MEMAAGTDWNWLDHLELAGWASGVGVGVGVGVVLGPIAW